MTNTRGQTGLVSESETDAEYGAERRCPWCGYDLAGVLVEEAVACPECGETVTTWEADPLNDWRLVRVERLLGLMGLSFVPVFAAAMSAWWTAHLFDLGPSSPGAWEWMWVALVVQLAVLPLVLIACGLLGWTLISSLPLRRIRAMVFGVAVVIGVVDVLVSLGAIVLHLLAMALWEVN